MVRIAIIDHDEHILYVEEIEDEVLARYDYDEQKFFDDNYDIENYSLDYITEGLFLPAGESDFCDIDFEKAIQ